LAAEATLPGVIGGAFDPGGSFGRNSPPGGRDLSLSRGGLALDALSQRGDRSVLAKIEPRLEDEKEVVRYTAAATIIHLDGLHK